MTQLNSTASPLPDSISVAQILHESVLHRSPALVLNLESKEVAVAEFESFWEDGVVLEILSGKIDSFPTGSLCCVAFTYGDCSQVFLSSVLEAHCRPAPDPPQLKLEPPIQIAGYNVSIRYRVPVSKDSGMEICINAEGRRLPGARALNVSLSGILVEFAEAADPRLPIGAALQVMLELGENRLILAGEVVHTRARQYGITFPDSRGGGIFDPPEPLRKIVRTLERAWLRERVRARNAGTGTETGQQR